MTGKTTTLHATQSATATKAAAYSRTKNVMLRKLTAAKDAEYKSGVRFVIVGVSDTAELPNREDVPLNPLLPYAVTQMHGFAPSF